MRTVFGIDPIKIGWAADAAIALIQHVGINHCSPNVAVTKQFLHGPDIVTVGGGNRVSLARSGDRVLCESAAADVEPGDLENQNDDAS